MLLRTKPVQNQVSHGLLIPCQQALYRSVLVLDKLKVLTHEQSTLHGYFVIRIVCFFFKIPLDICLHYSLSNIDFERISQNAYFFVVRNVYKTHG